MFGAGHRSECTFHHHQDHVMLRRAVHSARCSGGRKQSSAAANDFNFHPSLRTLPVPRWPHQALDPDSLLLLRLSSILLDTRQTHNPCVFGLAVITFLTQYVTKKCGFSIFITTRLLPHLSALFCRPSANNITGLSRI